MKTNKILKVMCIITLIIILVMVAFFGIYIKKNGKMTDVVKDFTTASEFGVEREYVFSISDATKTEYYDSEGNLVLNEDVDSNAADGTYTTKEVNVNPEEVKNVQNYQAAKSIVEKRIKDLGIEEYRLTVNEENGDIVLKTQQDDKIDNMIYALYGQGEFLLKDAETQEVLLSNSDIKDAKVGYYTEETGTNVYLTVNFNKEGTKKLENISSTYVKTTEKEDITAEDGTVTQQDKNVTKNVKLYIDGSLIVNTYFGETIKNGQLQLTMGEATTNSEELQNFLISASSEATKLSHGVIPVAYEVTQSANILSNFDSNKLNATIVVFVIMLTIILIYFVLRYKERGIMASILFVGFTALYLLVAKYANVVITYASLSGIIFIELFMVCFINRILYKLKKYNINEETPKLIINQNIIKAVTILIPALIMAVVFSMFTALAISSFGIAVFWGIILFMIYSYVFIRTLLLNFEYLFEQ